MFVSRSDFQKLAEARLADAELLLKHGRHSSAYYLAGYSIELALKAAVCRQILPECLPDRRLVNDAYTHDLVALVKLAGLSAELKTAEAVAKFKANWSIVAQWSEVSRYEMIDAFRAVELVRAIDDTSDGVFQWLKQYW